MKLKRTKLLWQAYISVRCLETWTVLKVMYTYVYGNRKMGYVHAAHGASAVAPDLCRRFRFGGRSGSCARGRWPAAKVVECLRSKGSSSTRCSGTSALSAFFIESMTGSVEGAELASVVDIIATQFFGADKSFVSTRRVLSAVISYHLAFRNRNTFGADVRHEN